MMILKRKGCLFLILVGMVILASPAVFISWYFWAGREVFAAYSAKVMASGVFVAGRTPESIASQELAILPFLKFTVNRDDQTVTTSLFHGSTKTGVYREGLGVALAHDGDVAKLKQQARPELVQDRNARKDTPWPMGDAPSGNPRPSGINEALLQNAVEGLFGLPTRFLKRHTRAVVVVYKDEIVAEKYADGFNADQRLLGWSMTKSIFHALCGIAVRQQKLSIQETVPFWQGANDPRAGITLDMLLRMSSGLDYNEFDPIPPTAQTTMLFLRPGAGDFGLTLPLLHPPNTVWAYASASTNIISRVLREKYGDDDYYRLPYQELFSKIGMQSAIIEADASGTFVGSSFSYATARDFARFGLLYLHDGVWQGERILPEGWVEYGRTPTPTAKGGFYGAHWWLISGAPFPEDVFFASGFEGQFIVVIPSRDTVIVWLALDLFSSSPADMVLDILDALPE